MGPPTEPRRDEKSLEIPCGRAERWAVSWRGRRSGARQRGCTDAMEGSGLWGNERGAGVRGERSGRGAYRGGRSRGVPRLRGVAVATRALGHRAWHYRGLAERGHVQFEGLLAVGQISVAFALLALARHALQRALLDVLEVLVFDDREEAEGGDRDERVLVVDLRDVRRPLVVEVAPLLLDPRDHRRLVHCGKLAVVAHLLHRAHLLEQMG